MPDPAHHPELTAKKRRRPPLSCEQCRRRKVKCDRSFPCNNCLKSKTETCTYAPTHTPKPRRRGAGAGGGADARAARAITPRDSSAASTSSSSDVSAPSRPGETTMPLDRGLASASAATMIRSPESEVFQRASAWQPLRPASVASGSVSLEAGGGGTQRNGGGAWRVDLREEAIHSSALPHHHCPASSVTKGSISKSRYFGQSHWMNIAASFPVELSMLKNQQHNQGELCQVLRQCKILCRNLKTKRFQPLSSLNIGKNAISRELADELVDAYLRTYEGVFRILHVPTFRKDYANYWETPAEASEPFVVLLQLVMALGSSIQETPSSLKTTANHWIYEAHMWLILPPEKDRMTLVGVQIMCLLTLVKMTCGVSSDLTWIMAGSLIRTAMYMGLHRDPSHLSQMTRYRAEMRRRLWATILELNLQYAFEAGGMPLISCDDYDALPPADLDDEELDDRIDDADKRPASRGVATQMSVAVALFRSFPVRLRLAQYINDFHSNLTYEDTLRLNSELTKACRAFTHIIGELTGRPPTPNRRPPPIRAFHIALAEVVLYRCFHTLHFPVLRISFEDPRYYFSRKMCLDGALKIADLWLFTSPRSARLHEPRSDFEQLTLAGTGMFKNIPIQAACIIALELLHEKGDGASGLGSLATAGGGGLRACLDEALGWTVQRLRAGELTAKAHCFLASCLAHVEALERRLDGAATMALLVERATAAARADEGILKEAAARNGVDVEEVRTAEAGGTEAGGTEAPVAMDDLLAGWDAAWAWDEHDDWMWGDSWSQVNMPTTVGNGNSLF